MGYRILIFIILNFGGLYLGSLYTSSGVASEWYFNLEKAPWSPPGWLFGVAWSIIMLCFSVYLAVLWREVQSSLRSVGVWFFLTWALNIAWNPLFFECRYVGIALLCISVLTVLIWFGMWRYQKKMGTYSLLLLPYGLWLLIATSLNAYIYLMN